ncbi:MAG: response regulator [SAR324 cluster bacterium]|nr:response regulator [SAR324 cluster bacterium]
MQKFENALQCQDDSDCDTCITKHCLKSPKFKELCYARDLAEAACRAKSTFLASMSHEIRTPMNAVIGMSNLLLKTRLTAKQKEYAESIQISGNHLLTLINDILDLSKIEAHKMSLENQPFGLNACVEEVMDIFGANLRPKNVELMYLIDPELPKVISGDMTRLRQILVNLLSNALKFTHQGEVLLSIGIQSVSENEIELLCFVKDTGIGISESQIQHIFDSFSQAEQSTTRKYGGTGLGLSISSQLVQMMGGRMWVESRVGYGSTFYFTFKTREVSYEEQAYLQQNIPELLNYRVLLIDQNPTHTCIWKTQLEHWGLRVRTTDSIEVACEWLAAGYRFDRVILDFEALQTPKEIKRLREKSQVPNLPILLFANILQPLPDEPNLVCLQKPLRQSQVFRELLKMVRCNPEAALVENIDEQDPSTQKNPLRILVAEDNEMNQIFTMDLLESMGYQAELAGNGMEALQLLEQQSFDVILMDVEMPIMGGYETTECIHQTYSDDDRPIVIACTAEAQEADQTRCLEAGMDDYLSKPIDEDKLLEKLVRWEHKIKDRNKLLKSEQKPILEQNTLSGLKPDTQKRLFQLFMETAPVSISKIRQAAEIGNCEQLEKESHYFKGSCIAIGASQLSSMCKILQKKGQNKDLSNIDFIFKRLDRIYQTTIDELKHDVTDKAHRMVLSRQTESVTANPCV